LNFRNKYQFSISFKNAIKASAASKPINDTRYTLSQLGFKDYSITSNDVSKGVVYYVTVLYKFLSFFFSLKKGSIVATQYPLPTVGYLINYLSKIGASKGISFIAVIHDVNSLRSEALTDKELKKEIRMLNSYNGLIVHNNIMRTWLTNNGLKTSTVAVPLDYFDYISDARVLSESTNYGLNHIAFAGHLAKSTFVYNLDHIKSWKFNIYGSDFQVEKNRNANTTWKGEFSPDEIVYHLEGSFGLVWDGADSNKIDTNRFGNYMRYNNPFKFSLYIAAGLPVIAPASAAIAKTIKEYNIGFLINTLEDLNDIQVSKDDYEVMKLNVKEIQKDIVKGNHLRKAVQSLETKLATN
jgi:hypothetical protein